jgi:hypothetical protein
MRIRNPDFYDQPHLSMTEFLTMPNQLSMEGGTKVSNIMTASWAPGIRVW